MSARDALHLSWIGQDVHDGQPRNPAAPLAELLATARCRRRRPRARCEGHRRGRDGVNHRPWLVRHPLQPFDARYFDGTRLRAVFLPRRFRADRSRSASDDGGRIGCRHRGLHGSARRCAESVGSRHRARCCATCSRHFRDPAKQFLVRRMKPAARCAQRTSAWTTASRSKPKASMRIENLARRLFLDAVERAAIARTARSAAGMAAG